MDVGAFVQENKRWLLGCAIGGVVWLVASSVIASMHAVTRPSARQLGAPDKVHDRATRDAARTENEQLLAERQRLQQELAFVPSAKYQVPGGGRGDEQLFKLGRELKQAIAAAAATRDVQFSESSVAWETATSPEDIRATLFGLELIDELQQRLFAAHDEVRARDETALGLRHVVSLKLDTRRNQRAQVRSVRPGEVDVRDLLAQESVQFQFLADEGTLHAFFEACRKPNRTLVVDSWTVLKPQRPGEPCAVKGVLLGIEFKQPAPPSTAAATAPPPPPGGVLARRGN
jgi:hypothetical protein